MEYTVCFEGILPHPNSIKCISPQSPDQIPTLALYAVILRMKKAYFFGFAIGYGPLMSESSETEFVRASTLVRHRGSPGERPLVFRTPYSKIRCPYSEVDVMQKFRSQRER